MHRALTAVVLAAVTITPLFAASDLQPAPPGAPADAPAQYTKFTTREIERGFLALAFGSDLRIGVKPKGIRRFVHPIQVFIKSAGSLDRRSAMADIVAEYGRKIPHLELAISADEESADVTIHLIDETNFQSALEDAFGRATTRAFVAKTNPQCMTSVKSQGDGEIVRSVTFVIVDRGDRVFFDCAYHELLHAFGLSNHDQNNPWTTLNQGRIVGYLSDYDRTLLTLLYDPRIRPGMTRAEVQRLLPRLISDATKAPTK